VKRAAVVVLTSMLGIGLVAGCDDDPPSRADVLGELASDVAVPGFESFASDAATLVEDIDEVCAAPSDESVRAALASVADTRSQWLSTQATWTGPVMDRRSPAVVDWPVRVADIEALIDRSAPGDITPDVIGNNVGADTRGLTAIRWVLEHDDVVALLEDERWCDYLRSSAAVIADEADLLVSDWTQSWDDGDAFEDVVADDAQADEWLAMFVNDTIFLVHELTEEPRDEGDVAPVDVSADRATQLSGVDDVYDTVDPLLGDELADRLGDEIEAAVGAFTAGDLERGRQLAAEVEATLSTEVVARLDITIGFSDADGDSAG
jgi:predicted lipoprotein